MTGTPRRRSGYLYRTTRKINWILRRGSLFRTAKVRATGPRKDRTIPGSTFALIAINSTFFFLLAYVLVYLIYALSVAVAASAFSIPTIVEINDISFMIKGVGWSSDAVKVVYSAGPLVALVCGIILVILANITVEENSILRLLLIWMFAHTMVFFFGEVMMGSLFSRGFGYVMMYLSAKDTVMMVVTVFALVGIAAAGFRSAHLFATTGNSYFNELPKYYLRRFLVFQFLIPCLAGNVIIFLLKLPFISYYDTGLTFTMLILLIPVLIEASRMDNFFYDEDPKRIRLYPVWILIAAAVLVLFRIVLGNGLRLFF